MKYVLICVSERDICEPEFFDSMEEAHAEMCQQLADVYGVPVEEINESYLSGEEYDGQTCVNEDSAWGERHGNNFDWKIFNIEAYVNYGATDNESCKE